MPAVTCPTCGANRWPQPEDPPPPPGAPEMARCGSCNTEHNVTELAVQAHRKHLQGIVKDLGFQVTVKEIQDATAGVRRQLYDQANFVLPSGRVVSVEEYLTMTKENAELIGKEEFIVLPEEDA